MTDKECELFLEDVLVLGKRLVQTGAEIKRVEDTIKKLCEAYDFDGIEIYAVTSLIVTTIKNSDGKHYTQSIRVHSGGTDLGRLEELNQEVRTICEKTPSIAELDKQVKGYTKPKPHPFIKCIGYMLAAGGFSVFFGGSWLDGIASAVIGIVIYFMDYHFKIRNVNSIVYTFIACLFSGGIALLMVHFGLGENADKVMIGDIMLFIPGLLLVNSVKEMLNRDIYTGLHRLVEAIFISVAIAGGYAVSMMALGGVL